MPIHQNLLLSLKGCSERDTIPESQMAEMIKIDSLPLSAADLKDTYSSVSDFINDMPSTLCWSDNATISHLKLFWSQDRDDLLNNNKGLELELEGIVEKIKSAVKGLDVFRFPTLFQIWAPKTVGSQQFLVSSDLPFGISSLRKGLCLYRKLCFEYKYSLDDEEELGPVGRVFRNGFPEFSPFVTCYSGQEFKLRNCAESCGVYGYLALPVFGADGKKCAYVIELITVFDGNYCLTDTIEDISRALKSIGLRSYHNNWLIDMDRCSQYEVALGEIERDLKVVCDAHGIPFAHTWFASANGDSTETVMRTSEKGSNMLLKKVSSFQKDCIQFGLKKGESVVWSAFTSCTSCFCKDVSQLSIKEYSLVLSARKVGLTAAFAICLKSLSIGDDDIFVLEFFLPTYNKSPTYFLNSLLATVLQHFKSFKVKASEIMVLKSPSGREELENTESKKRKAHHSLFKQHNVRSCSRDEGSLDNGGSMVIKAFYNEDIVKFQFPLSSGIIDLENEIKKRLNLGGGRFEIKYQNEADDCCILLASDADLNMVSERNQTIELLVLESVQNQGFETRDKKIITIKAKYKGDTIKFQLHLHSGLLELNGEVMKRLKIKGDSYKIKHLVENNKLIPVDDDNDLRNSMITATSLKSQTLRLLLEPVTNPFPEDGACPTPFSAAQATTETKNECKMVIKAAYKGDMIKFQLCSSSGMMDLKNEVTKRLKVSSESLRVKYRNVVDDDWIYLSGDEDLQNYLSRMASSSSKSAIKIELEPIQN